MGCAEAAKGISELYPSHNKTEQENKYKNDSEPRPVSFRCCLQTLEPGSGDDPKLRGITKHTKRWDLSEAGSYKQIQREGNCCGRGVRVL